MHIRVRPWAKQELKECNFFIDEPQTLIGKWKNHFTNNNPIHLELGIGKGKFFSKLALKNQNINFIGIDLIDSLLGISKREIEETYGEHKIDNILLTRLNIESILSIFNNEDTIDRIYINFCNPWPKLRHKKHRLTHTTQLNKYKVFLKTGGQIYFKTDNDELFEESLTYFNEANFKIEKFTYDLSSNDIFEGNIETVHEKMFKQKNIKIKALIATKID